MLRASDDFPEPLTPVIHVITPSGILTSMFLRLFSLAPRMTIERLHARGTAGVSMCRRPVR